MKFPYPNKLSLLFISFILQIIVIKLSEKIKTVKKVVFLIILIIFIARLYKKKKYINDNKRKKTATY